MVKSVTQKQQLQCENGVNSSSCKFKGVRKRKWGKYVSEIRLPNSRERIWLGSYDTAEKAARAFDAALFCLRGRTAKFNFPDNPPDIVNGRSLSPAEIQVAAARFANSEAREDHSCPGRVESLESENSSSISCSELQTDSPSPSVSDGAQQLNSEFGDIPFDAPFLDSVASFGMVNSNCSSNNNFPDYGIFPGFDDLSGDYFVPPFPTLDFGEEKNFEFSSEASFLWNF